MHFRDPSHGPAHEIILCLQNRENEPCPAWGALLVFLPQSSPGPGLDSNSLKPGDWLRGCNSLLW